jgi:hypothetical protein
MKYDITRLDKLLSFWIILYSICYIFNIFPYNPIILLYIALSFVIILVYILLNYENDILIYFIILNLIIKVPFILLIHRKKIYMIDIIFTIIFISIYFIYIRIINEDVITIYKELIWWFIVNKPQNYK